MPIGEEIADGRIFRKSCGVDTPAGVLDPPTVGVDADVEDDAVLL